MSSQPKVEVILKNCFSSIGEGPFWERDAQRLLCIDLFSGSVFRVDPIAKEYSKVQLDGTVGFAIPRTKGGYVVGLNNSAVKLDFESGKVEKIIEVEQGTQNRFNDAKCDSLGRLWAGTMGPLQDGKPVSLSSHLYSLTADYQLKSHLNNIGISNGMDWTDDNRVYYYIDSAAQNVVAFDFDLSSGTISNQRTVVTNDAVGTAPDGMCLDAEGKLWVAFYRGSKVNRYDPESGKILQTITFPVTNITSCCFGGKNLDELYVTSGRFGIPDSEINEKQPLAGSLFRVTGLGVKGRHFHKFEG